MLDGFKMKIGAVTVIIGGVIGLLTAISAALGQFGGDPGGFASVDLNTLFTSATLAITTIGGGIIAFGKAYKDEKLLKATEDNTQEVARAGRLTTNAIADIPAPK